MTRALTLDRSVELAVVERNGFDESHHIGAAVVTGPGGDPIVSLGDVSALIYPRSSLKPLQALAVRRRGLVLTEQSAVLSAASHAGTAAHIGVVRRILSDHGVIEGLLGCPAALPLDPVAARAAGGPTRVAHNCSGKHAAFLASSSCRGEDPGTYLDPAHPLQRDVVATIEDLASERIAHSGIDGCGAPLHALSLTGLARAIGRFVRDVDGVELTAAILADPWALDGHGRANTVVMEECGLLVKGGAEGVLVAASADGTAVALKILDGSARATSLVALTLLAAVGAVEAGAASRSADRVTEAVTGGDAVVGRIRVSAAVEHAG